MKFLNLLPVIGLAIALPALSQGVDEYRSFPDVAALQTWAGTSFGGSKVDTFTHGKEQVIVVDRMVTSGIASSVVSVFVKSDKGWVEALRLRQYSNYFVDAKQKGDWIILTIKSGKKEVLRFAISGLVLQASESGSVHVSSP